MLSARLSYEANLPFAQITASIRALSDSGNLEFWKYIFFLDSSAFNLILSKSLHLENALYPNWQDKPRLQVESKYSISLVKLIDESSIIKGNWKVIF